MTDSRRKGHDHERATAKWYRDHGYTARRGLQSQAEPNHTPPDVIVDELPLHIECKVAARGFAKVIDAYRQAERDAAKGLIPVVHLHQTSRGGDLPHLVVVSRDDWIDLMEDWERD